MREVDVVIVGAGHNGLVRPRTSPGLVGTCSFSSATSRWEVRSRAARSRVPASCTTCSRRTRTCSSAPRLRRARRRPRPPRPAVRHDQPALLERLPRRPQPARVPGCGSDTGIAGAPRPGDAAGWDQAAGAVRPLRAGAVRALRDPMRSPGAVRQLAHARRSLGAGGLDELGRLSLAPRGPSATTSSRPRRPRHWWRPGGCISTSAPTWRWAPCSPSSSSSPTCGTACPWWRAAPRGCPTRWPGSCGRRAARCGPPPRCGVVTVDGARATGVELDSGERIQARRALVANLTPGVLFSGMVPPEALPDEFRRRVARYVYGPGTMMIHAALSAPLAWAAGEDLHEFGYVHVGPYVDDMARTYAEALAGLLPSSPTLVVGQTTAIDPSRAPAGGHVLWVQVRMVPPRIGGDAARLDRGARLGGREAAAGGAGARQARAVRARRARAPSRLDGPRPGRPGAPQPEPGGRRQRRGKPPFLPEPALPSRAGVVGLQNARRPPLHGRRRHLAGGGSERDLGPAGGEDDHRSTRATHEARGCARRRRRGRRRCSRRLARQARRLGSDRPDQVTTRAACRSPTASRAFASSANIRQRTSLPAFNVKTNVTRPSTSTPLRLPRAR